MIDLVYDKLIGALPDLSADDLADALWLLAQMRRVAVSGLSEPKEASPRQSGLRSAAGGDAPTVGASKGPALPAEAKRRREGLGWEDDEALAPERTAALFPSQGAGAAAPFRTPAASALPGQRALARALRPMALSEPSRWRYTLDELATVHLMADARIWLPVLRPAREPHFEVALVIDGAPSLAIWRRTAEELALLLAHHSAFSDVRTWTLSFDESGRPLVQSGLFSGGQRPWRRASELVDPRGRRVILLLSDCVSAPWHDGRAARAIADWGRRGLVVLNQVLPALLWGRTALGAATPVLLRAAAPGAANVRLRHEPLRRGVGRKLPEGAVPVPVITLEPEGLSAWAQMISGDGAARPVGYLLNPQPRAAPRTAPAEAIDGPRQVALFHATASPIAIRLAGLLASAAPLTLNVARLIQSALLPEARQVHLAEIYLSGLLSRLDGDPTTNPDDISYEFHDGVRERLRGAAVSNDALQVLRVVSDYIAPRLGVTGSFRAFLDVLAAGDLSDDAKRRPFATVAAHVLSAYGDEYAAIAERLAHAADVELPSLSRRTRRQVTAPEAGAEAPPPQAAKPASASTAMPQQPTLPPSSASYSAPAPSTSVGVSGGRSTVADLEISLSRKGAQRYSLDLVFAQPDVNADVRPLAMQAVTVHFDYDRLRALELDPEAYGLALGEMLLGDPAVSSALAQAFALVASLNVTLSLRLAIAQDASELHALHWETLPDAQDGMPLAVRERVFFSRYLVSYDWLPVPLQARSELSALLAIAAPMGLENYGYAPVDAQAERYSILEASSGIPTTVMDRPDVLNLPGIIGRLRDGYDILYLLAQSVLVDGEPWLFLANEAGGVERVSGSDLVAWLAELDRPPRLIILSSPESSSAGSGEALSALASRLALARIPACITLQGAFSSESFAGFMPTLFKELQQHGEIDRAVAAARSAIRDRNDYWMPVLYTRLRSGSIWYVPGFRDERSFGKWATMLSSVQHGRATPIIGMDLLEPLLGLSRDLASRIADKYRYTNLGADRDELARVLGYIEVDQDRHFMQDVFREAMIDALQRRVGRDPASGEVSVNDQLSHAWRQLADGNLAEPYTLLAQLPVPIYIVAEPTSLLPHALLAAGKAPQVELCVWNDELSRNARSADRLDPPSAERPLVFYLFGTLDQPGSLVLTEDDYLEFLANVSGNREFIPDAVRRAFVDSALLFLGFPLSDLNFRVLSRAMTEPSASIRRARYSHVAVQNPATISRSEGTARIRRYQATYFRESSISLYWGSAQDFCRELAWRLKS